MKPAFQPSHTPWKSLQGLPHSHGYGDGCYIFQDRQTPPKTRNQSHSHRKGLVNHVPGLKRKGCTGTLSRLTVTAAGFMVGVFSRCMKGQRIRYQQTGEFHLLTFSCYRRRPHLAAVAAMELFEDALERVRLRYRFVVAGYVVMPEHVHLLVNEPQRALLSRAIQALKLSVAVRGREGPIWQAHYYDFNVSSHAKFVEKLRYVHRNPGPPAHELCAVGWNPVRRGLVAKPED